MSSGETQYLVTDTTGAKLRREVMIPLNNDGTAVLTSPAGGAVESQVTVRAAAILSASYVGTTTINMEGFNRCYFYFAVTIAQAVVATIKYQYSADDSTWGDYFNMLAAGSATGSEWLYTPYTYTVPLDLTAITNYHDECMEKRAKYIRAAIKYSGATTGKVAIYAQRFNV